RAVAHLPPPTRRSSDRSPFTQPRGLGSVTMTRTAELDALQAVVDPESWSTRPADRAKMAHDASHYLLTPSAVVTPQSLPELVAAPAAAHHRRTPVTFRTAGTSLSGQAGTDGVLIDVRRHFQLV